MKKADIKKIKLRRIDKEHPKLRFGKAKGLSMNVSPSQGLLEKITPPRRNNLKPIQALSSVSLRPSKSSNASPDKSSYKRSELVSPKMSLLKLDSKKADINQRRTQSMNNDLWDEAGFKANFISQCIYKTRVGQANGKSKKDNQDAFIIHSNLNGNLSNYLFSVCDGHGANGHFVSRLLKKKFAKKFESFLNEYKSQENSIKRAYAATVKSCEGLLREAKIDTQASGSTMVSVVVLSNLLVCANIGDSRAVLGKKTNGWVAEDLSRDHKPELPDEAARIRDKNGRIFPFVAFNGQQLGPHRVWLPYEDIPGLAMSRSIGDDIAASVGVVSDPEFSSRVIGSKDFFMIVASDGLWEFISSKEAVQVVGNLLDSGKQAFACDELVSLAVKRWNKIDGGVDDITVLVVFINKY